MKPGELDRRAKLHFAREAPGDAPALNHNPLDRKDS